MSKATDKLRQLQERLLDISTRNRMLNSNFKGRSKQHFRFIDEIPDNLYETLIRKKMEFKSLPDFDTVPEDEKTQKFKEALEKAMQTDEEYLEKQAEIEKKEGGEIDEATEASLRELKNRVRKKLRMPSFEGEQPSLVEHARMHKLDPSFDLPRPNEGEGTGDKRHTDKAIQTLMVPDTQNRYLSNIHSQYRSSLKEQGINPLYICFGFLEWKENSADKKLKYAPLLMLQVSMEKKVNDNKLLITSTGDDIIYNQTLNEKLKRAFNVSLPDIKFSDDESKSFGIEEYLEKVEKKVAEKFNFKVKNWGAFGIYNAQNMPIFRDIEEIIKAGPSNLLEKLLLGSDIRSEDNASAIYGVDSDEIFNELPTVAIPADASQFSAVVDALRGKDFVIQGPPGTGKSQTIANMIAVLMQNGKKVLFVAQKQAALDVVRNNLQAIGLGIYLLDIFSVRLNKKAVMESFAERLDERYMEFDIPDYEGNLQDLRDIKLKLNKYADMIKDKLGNTNITIHDLIWDTPDLKSEIPEPLHFSNTEDAIDISEKDLNHRMDDLKYLTKMYLETFKGKSHEKFCISRINKQITNPYDIKKAEKALQDLYNGLKTLHDKKLAQEDKHKDLKKVSLDDGEFLNAVDLVKKKKSEFKRSELITILIALHPAASDAFSKLCKLTEKRDALKELEKRMKQTFNLKDDVISEAQIKRALVEFKNQNLFSFLFSKFREAKQTFDFLYTGDRVQSSQKYDLLYEFYNFRKNSKKRREEAARIEKGITKLNLEIKKYIPSFSKDAFSKNDINYFENTKAIVSSCDKDTREFWFGDWDELRKYVLLLEDIGNQSKAPCAYISDLTGEELSSLEAYQFLSDIVDSPVKLVSYMEWLNTVNKPEHKDIVDFFTKYRELKLSDAEIDQVYKLVVREAQHKEIYKKHPDFGEYKSSYLNKLSARMGTLDEKVGEEAPMAISNIIEEQAEDAPEGISRGKVGEKTERALIEHVASKTGTRTTIRELLERASEAATCLKPCTLMSPLTVSQTLPLDELYDVVVIDEASQMKPEFALCSIARAKQAIIVGDPNQLPPTSFFQATNDTEVDGEDADESILDMASSVFEGPRKLLYHYRSRHENLIKFSNVEFYDKDLMIPVTAHYDDLDKGVSYIFVNDAKYHPSVSGQGGGGINPKEAERVIDEVIELMKTRPDESIGVATMNLKQTEYIKREFELRADVDNEVAQYLQEWEEREEGLHEFFIKNLENVQGDERDIIVISTLYGPPNKSIDSDKKSDKQENKVAQRFGAINREDGWRRLNVLFTRARNQMIIVTSIKSTDIRISENSSRGPVVFQKAMKFFETQGIEDITDAGNTQSPFQKWVIAQVNLLPGFSAHMGIGHKGYYVDIGVKHKNCEGYILGIETDGETYQSFRSARDRDLLIPQILEEYDWDLYRIWSTDWISDPERTKEKLLKALQEAAKTKKKSKN